MTGATHKQFSIGFAYIVLVIIWLMGLNVINHYLTLIIVLPVAKIGSKFPDYDHCWANIGDKTFGIWLINKFIRGTGGVHRSAHTHSWDIAILFTAIVVSITNILYYQGVIRVVDKDVMLVLILGFVSGWISHLFSDMLTAEGVRLFFWWKRKIRLVPKSIKLLKWTIYRFSTDSDWEKRVKKIATGLNMVLLVICLSLPVIEISGIYNIRETEMIKEYAKSIHGFIE